MKSQVISEEVVAIATKFDKICAFLEERSSKRWYAVESEFPGYGGVTLVHEVTGISKITIN